MTHNTDFLGRLDEYCLGQLSEFQKQEFEAELARNSELRDELKLQLEIWDSVLEKDVLTLRNKLQEITGHENHGGNGSRYYGISDNIESEPHSNKILSDEELVRFFSSLPKIHAYQHLTSASENIHTFYKNQQTTAKEDQESTFDVESEEHLTGLEEAILEKDIIEFRQKLQKVAQSVETGRAVEEIDEYLNNNLAGDDLIEFERDLLINQSLKEEVDLHRELESALLETDILELRKEISQIIRSETSWNVSSESIEDFIDGTLEGILLDELNAELDENPDLQAEIRLRKQVNEFLSEKDIFELRNQLKAAKDTAETNEVKMLIPDNKNRYRLWRNSAAAILVIIGISGIFSNGFFSVKSISEKYYESPTWSVQRTVNNESSALDDAKSYYLQSDYEMALETLEKIPENAVVLFYKAASYQELGKFDDAINNYSKVINEGDNLFIEEAEWYRCLCYLQKGEKIMARQQLNAIIQRQGDFERDAKAILRKIRYSLKT